MISWICFYSWISLRTWSKHLRGGFKSIPKFLQESILITFDFIYIYIGSIALRWKFCYPSRSPSASLSRTLDNFFRAIFSVCLVKTPNRRIRKNGPIFCPFDSNLQLVSISKYLTRVEIFFNVTIEFFLQRCMTEAWYLTF